MVRKGSGGWVKGKGEERRGEGRGIYERGEEGKDVGGRMGKDRKGPKGNYVQLSIVLPRLSASLLCNVVLYCSYIGTLCM
jgi:hypothetical protein